MRNVALRRTPELTGPGSHRQRHMDYATNWVLAFLNGIATVLILYDIMCQYVIRFKIRIGENFTPDMLAELESITTVDFPDIIAGVGKYHLSMHTQSCREKFSMHHLPCSCVDDGETCERL